MWNSSKNENNHLCRVCLNDSLPKFDLKRKLNSHSNVSLLNALETIMNCKVVLSKKVPNRICSICMNILELSFNFKNRFDDNQLKLTEELNKYKTNSDEHSVNESEKINGNISDEAMKSMEKLENNAPANDIISHMEPSKKRPLTDEKSDTNNSIGTDRIKSRKFEKPMQEIKNAEALETIIIEHVPKYDEKIEKKIRLECKFCNFKTEDVDMLQSHIEAQHFREVFKCKVCNYRTKDRKTWKITLIKSI